MGIVRVCSVENFPALHGEVIREKKFLNDEYLALPRRACSDDVPTVLIKRGDLIDSPLILFFSRSFLLRARKNSDYFPRCVAPAREKLNIYILRVGVPFLQQVEPSRAGIPLSRFLLMCYFHYLRSSLASHQPVFFRCNRSVSGEARP